eukprot:297664-Hanusia_phi.AAC.3
MPRILPGCRDMVDQRFEGGNFRICINTLMRVMRAVQALFEDVISIDDEQIMYVGFALKSLGRLALRQVQLSHAKVDFDKHHAGLRAHDHGHVRAEAAGLSGAASDQKRGDMEEPALARLLRGPASPLCPAHTRAFR